MNFSTGRSITLTLTALVFSLLTFSCIFGSQKQSKKPTENAAIENWEDYLKTRLQDEHAFDQAWALLSESGMEDSGQIMVFVNSKRSTAELEYAGKNKRSISTTSPLTPKQYMEISSAVKKSENLKSFNPPIFDGVTFRYLHLQIKNRNLQVIKDIKINNPEVADPPPQEHLNLIHAFQQLINS